MLNNLTESDIMYQIAVVEEEKLVDGKLVLRINDANGLINKPFKIDWNEFEKEFTPHPQLKDHFIRQVQIDSISGNTVFFIRLDKKGRPCSSVRVIHEKFFVEQFLYADQVGLE